MLEDKANIQRDLWDWTNRLMGTSRSSKKRNAKFCNWGGIAPCTCTCCSLSGKQLCGKGPEPFSTRVGDPGGQNGKQGQCTLRGEEPAGRRIIPLYWALWEHASFRSTEDNTEFPELSLGAKTLPVTNAYVVTLINFGCKKGEIHWWKGVENVYIVD